MDAKGFLAEFRHIAGRPEGVARIRQLVLQLAITGDLSRSLLTDGAVRDLLESNRGAREALIARGDLRKQVPLLPLALNEVPWTAPLHWTWCRLGDLTNYGDAIKAEPGEASEDTWVLELEDIEKGSSRLLQRVVARERPFKSTKNRFGRGAVLYGKLRPYLDKVLIADADGVCSTEISPITFFEGVEAAYLRWYLKSPYFVEYASRSTHGMNLPRLGTNVARNAPFPLPPLGEQQRIVAKVDELMALCDKLEAEQQRREELRSVTRKAACRELASVRDADGLTSAWRRVRDSMELWMDAPEFVDDLEQALGYMGCMGLLNGAEFPLSEGAAEAKPALPPGWRWTVLGDLAEYITSGSRGWRQYIAGEGDVFIRSQDIKHDELRFEDRAFVALPEKAEGKRTLVRVGDLLMTITGANVGKCAQMPALECKAYVSQHVALVRVKDARHTPFLHAWITNAYGGRQHLARFIYGDKPGLNLPQVAGIPVPLPPQDVQDRIVDSLRHYRTLCGRLTSQLDEATKLVQALAHASVAAITGIRTEERIDMKAPKTELISNLQSGAVPPTAQDAAPLAALLSKHPAGMPAKALWSASDLEIDAFYQQLKAEMAQGWIVQPELATMREVATS